MFSLYVIRRGRDSIRLLTCWWRANRDVCTTCSQPSTSNPLSITSRLQARTLVLFIKQLYGKVGTKHCFSLPICLFFFPYHQTSFQHPIRHFSSLHCILSACFRIYLSGVLSTTGMSTNYVVALELPIAPTETQQKWILAGVAALCNLTD